MDAVKALWEGVVRPRWRAFRRGSVDDKQSLPMGFVHGTSGVGKTRFDLKFLGLLADYLTQDASTGKPADDDDDEVDLLRAALQNSKTVVLDIRQITDMFQNVKVECPPPEVLLGLQLTHKYWLPHLPHYEVCNRFWWRVIEDASLWDTFKLESVLSAIEQHKAAPTKADPSPRIPDVLHIAIDEIQSAFDFMVPCHGHAGQLEPLSAGLNRALQGAISQSRLGIFVLGTLSGTALRHVADALDTTDATTTGVLLSPLSAESVRQIVASFQVTIQIEGQPALSGEDWYGRMPFERILDTVGGNPRALECLERVLEGEGGSPYESIRLNRISVKLAEELAQTFNIESWGRQGAGVFGILLALAGIPVTRESVVGFEKPSTPHQQQGRPITVADLERAGVVHLHSPPELSPKQTDRWVDTWDVKGYNAMEVPFVLSQAALAVAAKHPHREHERELLDQASNFRADFYPTTSSFEKLAFEHRVLRHNVASEWARRQGRAYVEARDLFCGSICHPSFTKLRFVPATTVRHVSEASVRGVWWKAAIDPGGHVSQEVNVRDTSVILRDSTKVELRSTSPYAILISAESCSVAGLLNEQLSHTPDKFELKPTVYGMQNVRVHINTKHTHTGTPTSLTDIKALINKRRSIVEWFPNEEHIMVITSDRPAMTAYFKAATNLLQAPTKPDQDGRVIEVTDLRTCVIIATDDSLAWAMAPTFARFLVYSNLRKPKPKVARRAKRSAPRK